MPEQAEVHQRLRDDRQRAHARHHAQEQREHQRIRAVGPQPGRHQEPRRDAQAERHEHPRDADGDDRAAAAAQHAGVQLGAGQRDQQEHAELGHDVEQVELGGIARKQPREEFGCRIAEHGRSEQHARRQFAHDRGNPDGPGQRAEQPGRH
ncbi:hypothetical protein GCM10020001_043940 [Nonomuraea salmonea]